MNRLRTPQSRCRAAAGRADITPPPGIYHRMWGAALHDRATGVHRPLTATVLWLEPEAGQPDDSRLIVSLDHCVLDPAETQNIRESVSDSTGLPVGHIHLALTHTHGSGWMSRTRSDLPGGEFIGPYMDQLAETVAQLAVETRKNLQWATIVYGTGRCSLAAHRDYLDVERQQFVCGFNPTGAADDTLMVARVINESGTALAVVVNYACHPTTLAWENTLISPDWVGAMREIVEGHEQAPCLFLQGASADLGPRDGFVGDTGVADRNGRQVGFAAAATLESLPAPGTEFVYAGPVVSGATLGTWKHVSLPESELIRQGAWCWKQFTVELPYRHDLPTIEQTTSEREKWLQEEAAAIANRDDARLQLCRAQIEQRTRQLARLHSLAPGKSWPEQVEIGILGDAIWILLPGELYQAFQLTLRQRFAPRPVIVSTLTNGWQPGYIPAAGVYGYGIYQEIIAATSPGSLEILIEAICREIQQITSH